MKRIFVLLLAAVLLLQAAPRKPKLVLAIVIDQFRYDYLTRFRSEYHAGFDRLLTKGAVFTNARYEHFPTVTAIGHSTILSGATPSISGIIGNDWYDRDDGGKVTSVSDPKTQLLGGNGTGSSPRRMLVDTVGDELKIADNGKSRVIGISLKDRAAILPAGHMADGAYWFDTRSGNFVSSTYYFADLPGWVKDFNATRPADKYQSATWLNRKLPPAAPQLYSAIDASPFGNEMIESFAERALDAEQLGKRDVTDVLAVSFSSNDYVGHALGPDSPEVHEISVRTDAILEKLFQAVDRAVGLDNALVILTADHGVAPVPEVNTARKMPGGRIPAGTFTKTVQAALTEKYGEGQWIVSDSDHSLYFNLPLIEQKKLDRAEVNRFAADVALHLPHVFRVYTREQLMAGLAQEDQVARRVMNGFYVRRGPDVEILLEPYWMYAATGTTHGTTFSYDSHVPVILMGAGIRPGRYYNPIAVNDIAPTLAAILEVETPFGSVGRVLSESFE
ncbi:MAG TPA: alkaline phosphatase family protein [Bryobacteraceae bacterium]